MKQLVLSFFVLFLTVMAASAQRPQLHKLSPMLRQMVAQRETPTVCAFIRITDDADRILRQNGCQKLAQAGNIYIAAIPADRLGALSQERNVSRIEARRGTHALMDSMAIHCRNESAAGLYG